MKTGHFKTGHTLFILSLILMSSLALVTCGTQSPVGPSDSATIEGFVNPASGASALSRSLSNHVTVASAPRGGITISIMGTNLTATTDASGHFVISGVPTGTVTIRFQGPGIDAQLGISGLQAGQTLTITVQVSGGQATLVSVNPSPSPTSSTSPSSSPSPSTKCFSAGEHAEVEGKITAKTSSSIDVFQEGEVKGDYLCQVSTGTNIRKGNTTLTLAQLQVGWQVHVKGTGLGLSGPKCQVKAEEIIVQHE